MWRALMSSRFASWVVGKVSLPKERQLQHELDLQRLYILTQVHKAASQGKTANMQQLILKSQALEPSAVRSEVEAALRRQVLAAATALHEELVQACDPTPAAARVTDAHARLQRRREHEASGLRKLLKRLTDRQQQHQQKQVQTPAAAAAAAAAVAAPPHADPATNSGASDSSGTHPHSSPPASTSASAAGGGNELGASAVAAALRRRLGFSLELRPSSVPHPEAGTGVFLRGKARPGSVVALFPGVLYGRTQLAHMPNFPRVDTDNPYLSCRYDQGIVDSKPWGRGDPGQDGPAAAATAGAGAGSSAGGAAAAPGSAGSAADPSPSAADTGSCGQSDTAPDADGGRRWWQWAGPLSASLSLLEGRHPLALGHFVNHPGQGQSPNVLEASLDVPLDHPDLDLPARPWLRAYLPTVQPPLDYDPYGKYTDGEDDDDDEEEEEGEETAAQGAGAGAKPKARRAPGELRPHEVLSPPGGVVRLLVLVATRGIKEGEELLQNYRMNPHVARPDWYVVHDAEAEARRWAKIRSLDLGFKGSKAAQSAQAQQQTQGGAPPAGGGGGGGSAAG